MQIELNGEIRIVPDDLTIESLLAHLALESERLAVERNREVVTRSDWQRVVLAENDQVEIIHFVGGGTSE